MTGRARKRKAKLGRQSRAETRSSDNRLRIHDPRLGAGLILLGCFLALYLLGLVLIPAGLWLLRHRETDIPRGAVAKA